MPNLYPYRLGRDHGAWRRGELVQLDDDTAGLLTRANAPGLLIPVGSDGHSVGAGPVPALSDQPSARAIESPPADRRQRGRSNRGAPKPTPPPEPKRRKDRQGDPGDQGAMGKSDHPALLRGDA